MAKLEKIKAINLKTIFMKKTKARNRVIIIIGVFAYLSLTYVLNNFEDFNTPSIDHNAPHHGKTRAEVKADNDALVEWYIDENY